MVKIYTIGALMAMMLSQSCGTAQAWTVELSYTEPVRLDVNLDVSDREKLKETTLYYQVFNGKTTSRPKKIITPASTPDGGTTVTVTVTVPDYTKKCNAEATLTWWTTATAMDKTVSAQSDTIIHHFGAWQPICALQAVRPPKGLTSTVTRKYN